MRSPFQILMIPFRRTETRLEFAVLRRSEEGWWQFVADGGEEEETPIQAALRETGEEIGIWDARGWITLDSMSAIPKCNFGAADSWDPSLYVTPEYCFAVDAGSQALTLFREHEECRWVPCDEAYGLLRWDSNRIALWELNERLKVQSRAGTDGTGRLRTLTGCHPVSLPPLAGACGPSTEHRARQKHES